MSASFVSSLTLPPADWHWKSSGEIRVSKSGAKMRRAALPFSWLPPPKGFYFKKLFMGTYHHLVEADGIKGWERS